MRIISIRLKKKQNSEITAFSKSINFSLQNGRKISFFVSKLFRSKEIMLNEMF